MSRFYGSLRGDRPTTSTRCGHRGMVGHVRGWNSGVQVESFAGDDGKDCHRVLVTSGSNATSAGFVVGTVRETDQGPVWDAMPEAVPGVRELIEAAKFCLNCNTMTEMDPQGLSRLEAALKKLGRL